MKQLIPKQKPWKGNFPNEANLLSQEKLLQSKEKHFPKPYNS